MKSRGAISLGYECVLIDVECHISNNLPGITIVGLATRSVDESRERIRAAFSASGLELPRRKILINLAPADIAKDDSGLDFAIAAAIIGKDMAKGLGNSAYIGELGLDGILKPVRGLVGKLLEARSQGVDSVYVPEVMSEQAALVPGIKIYPIKNLRQFVSIIQGEEIQLVRSSSSKNAPKREYLLDDIVGQAHAKRALLVAAAGRHNLHMYGPPGTGKTMLAKAASELLPNLSREESLVVTHIHSLATHESDAIIDQAPFRAPHHTASDISIIGGGSHARPGEISLAHLGILMLDELPEYSKSTLEALRQPLEDKRVTVSRARVSTTYPADFMLIATSNPCPCGFYGSDKPCSCSPYEIIRYQKRLSGPIMDRIDMHIQVNAIDPEKLLENVAQKQKTVDYKKIVAGAHESQRNRNSGKLNCLLSAKQLNKFGQLSTEAKHFLDQAAHSLKFSSRAYIRIVRVARTIADLEHSEEISKNHIGEALQYRQRDSIL